MFDNRRWNYIETEEKIIFLSRKYEGMDVSYYFVNGKVVYQVKGKDVNLCSYIDEQRIEMFCK